MSIVLLGWELGDGLGHVTKVLEVANELGNRGHTPVLVLQNLSVASPLLRASRFRIFQSPVCLDSVPRAFRAASYADVLMAKGYTNADGLALRVAAWQNLIEFTRAELVICDFAPTLCLAAFGVAPAVVMGIGFAVPPAEGADFPDLRPRLGTTSQADRILDVVREVQERRGGPIPETLPALFAGSAQFVHTIEEIDAYNGYRALGTVVEPLRRPPPPLPPAPLNSFFAYLNAEYPGVELILPELAAKGFHGTAYVRNASTSLISAARRAGIVIHDEPLPLSELLPRSAVVIHHGGLNTAEAALAAGRPQLTLPSHLEHILTGDALMKLGVGRSLRGNYRVASVSELVQEILAPGGCLERASSFAEAIQSRDYQGCLYKILDCCASLLGRSIE